MKNTVKCTNCTLKKCQDWQFFNEVGTGKPPSLDGCFKSILLKVLSNKYT